MPTLYDNFSQVRQYIDENNTSYVSKTELANASYITSSQLSDCSYATTSYVADYVATYGGGVIDENIIPKEDNTYTLGNVSRRYSSINARDVVLNSKVKFRSDGNNAQLVWLFDNNYKWVMNENTLYPYGSQNNNVLSLGKSDRRFLNTYTTNIYTDTAYLQDTSYSSSIIPKENNTYSLGSSNAVFSTIWTPVLNCSSTFRIKENNSIKYEFYQGVFQPASDKSIKLGDSDKKWAATYTANLYADNIHNFIWTGTAAEYTALSDYTTYQFYLVQES